MRKLIALLVAVMLVLTLVPAMAEEPITIGVVYKQTGNPFFEAAVKGFTEASEELGFNFIHNGPADGSAEGQIQIIEGYIAQEVDAIAISANDAAAVVPVLQQAMNQGIIVVSWDSAVNPEGRNLNIDPSNAENIGRVQIEEISKQIGGEGQIAILSAASTADNQNTWIEYMKKTLEDPQYAAIELVTVVYGDDDTAKSYQEMQGLIDSYPDLKGVIAPTTMGIAAAANCVKDNGKTGQIKVTGLGLPSEMADYITEGVCEGMYLWNPIDLGYCAGYACVAMVNGTFDASVGATFEAGRLGSREVYDDGNGNGYTIVGDPYNFTAENIADWKDVY